MLGYRAFTLLYSKVLNCGALSDTPQNDSNSHDLTSRTREH